MAFKFALRDGTHDSDVLRFKTIKVSRKTSSQMHRLAVFPRVSERVLDPRQRRFPLSGKLKCNAFLADHYLLDFRWVRNGRLSSCI